MASLVKDLVEAGIHLGHLSSHWNPKMKPFIFGKRNRIHIIDIKSTVKGLLLARKFITRVVTSGKDVLFVGTKRQARNAIETHVPDTGMHWVTERWLGGTLTNFRTIRERLKRLEELEGLEVSGEINNYSKKMESQLRREKEKIRRNLDGIRRMSKLPGVMVVIDVDHEINAVKEARKLGIPSVCLIDTDSNPDFADIPIPGNDDAMRAIEVVVDQLCRAIMEGKNAHRLSAEGKDQPVDDSSQPPRRSTRAPYRASETISVGEGAESSDESTQPPVEVSGAAPPDEPGSITTVPGTEPPTNRQAQA